MWLPTCPLTRTSRQVESSGLHGEVRARPMPRLCGPAPCVCICHSQWLPAFPPDTTPVPARRKAGDWSPSAGKRGRRRRCEGGKRKVDVGASRQSKGKAGTGEVPLSVQHVLHNSRYHTFPCPACWTPTFLPLRLSSVVAGPQASCTQEGAPPQEADESRGATESRWLRDLDPGAQLSVRQKEANTDVGSPGSAPSNHETGLQSRVKAWK